MSLRDVLPFRRAGAVAPARREVDPFVSLQSRLNRLIHDFEQDFTGGLPPALAACADARLASTDVAETDTEIEITTELPGVDAKNVDVKVTADRVVIKGEKLGQREDKAKDRVVTERSYGSFERIVPLPEGVNLDAAKAEFKNGVLTVTLPKSPSATQKGRIVPVTAG